jgi:hypothetical protein
MAAEIKRPDITPDMKVGVLLDAYPELTDVLIGIAPAFKKLRNPVLRRTVAKLTSLRQAAQVGGVSLGEMIGKLRTAAGIQEEWQGEETTSADTARPDWFDPAKIVDTFDATELIEGGGHPLPEVMSTLRGLEAEQIYAIVTPFTPAPMIDKAGEAGYRAWCEQTGTEEFKTYFSRKENK